MTMNIVLADAIAKPLVNSVTNSVTLTANDFLIFHVVWRKTGSAAASAFNTFTWNGQPCTIAIDQNSRDIRSITGYVKANSSATANLVSSVSSVYTQVNLDILVVRSPTNAMLSNPIKSYAVTKSDDEAVWVAPSISVSGLVPNDISVAFLDWAGHSKTLASVVTTTATPDLPLTLSDSVQQTDNPANPGRAYISSATGLTGSQTFSYSRVGAGAPMYNASVIVLYESLTLLDTITNPLVPNAAFTATCTGFSDGAATLSFAGISIPVTIAAGVFNGTVPMIADNVLWPKLPATGQTYTLTQGVKVATLIGQSISLPTLFEVVRDIALAPANFYGLVTDDTKYLAYNFAAQGNPLTVNDTAVFPTSFGYKIKQSSEISVAIDSPMPRTDTIYIYRGASGKYFEHTVILNSIGEIVDVIAPPPLSIVPITMLPITMVPITMIGIN